MVDRSLRDDLHLSSPVWAAAGLTVLGGAVRAAGVNESLFGDELFTVHVTAGDDVSDVVERVKAPGTEVSPPFFFLIAWLGRRLGNPDYVWMRTPSVLFGTATVPLIFVLGTQLLRRWTAVVAAGLYALLPFAIFYSTEARPYATLTFLVVLSAIALLVALRSGHVVWWVVYAAATGAALYTHYTGVFVLGAQVLWALLAYPSRRAGILAWTAAAAASYLPWLPHLSGKGQLAFAYGGHPTLESVAESVLRALAGFPYVALDALPGTVALVVLGLSLALAGLLTLSQHPPRRDAPSVSAVALLVALLLVTPIGVLAYSLASGNDIFLPRNLSASVPAAALLAALVLTTPRGAPGVTLSLAALCTLGVGAAKTLDPDTQRPAFKEAARYVDRHATAGEPVIDVSYHPPWSPLGRRLQPYLRRPHLIFQAGHDAAAWRLAADGRRVFLVLEQGGLFARIPRRLGPRYRFTPRGQSPTYPGQAPVVVVIYRAG